MDTAAQGLLSRDEMESRRLLAAQDLQTGLSQSQIARKFGVSRTTASRWNRTLSGKGVESLRKRRAPGRPSRLTADQLKILTDTYQAGPRAAGFDTDRWTTARFADVIFSAVRRALRSRSCGTHHAPPGAARAPPFARRSRRTCFTRSRLPRWICRKFRQTWRKFRASSTWPVHRQGRPS